MLIGLGSESYWRGIPYPDVDIFRSSWFNSAKYAMAVMKEDLKMAQEKGKISSTDYESLTRQIIPLNEKLTSARIKGEEARLLTTSASKNAQLFAWKRDNDW